MSVKLRLVILIVVIANIVTAIISPETELCILGLGLVAEILFLIWYALLYDVFLWLRELKNDLVYEYRTSKYTKYKYKDVIDRINHKLDGIEKYRNKIQDNYVFDSALRIENNTTNIMFSLRADECRNSDIYESIDECLTLCILLLISYLKSWHDEEYDNNRARREINKSIKKIADGIGTINTELQEARLNKRRVI